jgi:hypothetical protein
MSKDNPKVFLNQFPVKKLTDGDKIVQVYEYTFNPSPEPGKEYSAINRILWKIRTPGTRLKSTIITKQLVSDEYLEQDNWTLKHQGTQLLDLDITYEREALKKLERKWLEQQLRYKFDRNRVNRASEGGFIWWDADSIILQGLGWEVHTGVRLDIELHSSGVIFIEIDLHHRFYSSWTLEHWLQNYRDMPVSWVRNTYDERSWKFLRVSDENPETTMIPNFGSLAKYHRNLGATEKEIKDGRVVYVSSDSKGKELTHLSTRLRPSITMEILSNLQDTQTILVVSPWLQNTVKAQLQKEALEANIALQFMQPMVREEKYRIANIVLGLLVKAKWQPVGLEPLQDKYVAELVIGFDAGTNGDLYYGTSAFAILANGQSLGWELPEAQRGEKISSEAIERTIFNIITRFQKIENRLPRRVLILRDGIVQCEEFDDVVGTLLKNKIAVDLLSVRKSGAGRMAVQNENGKLIDAVPGTAILSTDDKTFFIVTSEAKAGGSARPLKIVRDFGDAPLETLARQVDRLCMLNPASAYAYSRLPYVIHFADKMAKTVQRIGELSVLHGLDRQKIFFA